MVAMPGVEGEVIENDITSEFSESELEGGEETG
jgi:hypothetical protein